MLYRSRCVSADRVCTPTRLGVLVCGAVGASSLFPSQRAVMSVSPHRLLRSRQSNKQPRLWPTEPRPQSARAAARTQRHHQSIPLSLICQWPGGELERVGEGGGSVKGLLSHSQSARKERGRQAASSITGRGEASGAADGVEGGEGFINSICFGVWNRRIHTASRLLDAAAPVRFNYATCKKKTKTKEIRKQASRAAPLHGATVEGRDEGMR